ncbi:hypothetical protein L2E82_30384 [Cichorium intybus]|uniref:Uncharacterized protein n=1 Tax=Cichorium intybus TaxID=13427 RepID=A0ACB9D0K3_CICIN|nr:hypothetical protein L2E82_30384 [Cichorium intybus]
MVSLLGNSYSRVITGYLTTVGTSQRQLGGLALSQNVCFMQQNQEFSIQNEHSPALPGYKGTRMWRRGADSDGYVANFVESEQVVHLNGNIGPFLQGVLEAVRIRCAGYPTRQTFDKFLLRFGVLYLDVLDGKYDSIGKTKAFLRAGQMAEVDTRRAEVLGNAAKIIQRQMRTCIARKEYISIREATIQLQAYWRGTWLLANLASKSYVTLRESVVILQSGLRAMTARDEFRLRKQTKAAIYIQVLWAT